MKKLLLSVSAIILTDSQNKIIICFPSFDNIRPLFGKNSFAKIWTQTVYDGNNASLFI